jgi:hypothetical protein
MIKLNLLKLIFMILLEIKLLKLVVKPVVIITHLLLNKLVIMVDSHQSYHL